MSFPYLCPLNTTKARNVMGGIYLHIPFCKRRCVYCDFYSTTRDDLRKAYVDALCLELAARRNYMDGEAVETVYFGGGTPSRLDEEDFGKLFDAVSRHYTLVGKPEITLEANPDDLSPEYIRMLRRFPFNRLSMGVQTFHDETLRLLYRRHTASQAIGAYNSCRDAGFDNISLDLMYGLPGETLEDWESDLAKVVALHPEHISAYHLIYEEGTELWNLRERHRVSEADEELSVSLFSTLIRRLRDSGYRHYEISNFCLPDRHSRHNSSYWTGKKYLGCGPSAHSYNGTSRQWNTASLVDYIASVNTGGMPAFGSEQLNLHTRYNDFVITTLRTSWGMPLAVLRERFGGVLSDYCFRMASPHLSQGTLEIRDNILRLTEKGIFISDGIMSDLLWVDD